MLKFYQALFVGLALCFGAHAQFEKGSQLLGGQFSFDLDQSSLSFANNTEGDQSTTTINASPTYGYFFNSNFALRAGLELQLVSQEIQNNMARTEQSLTSYGFSMGASYYSNPILGDRAFLAFPVDLLFGGVNNEVNSTANGISFSDFQTSATYYGLGAGAGFGLFLSESITWESYLLYRYRVYNDTSEDQANAGFSQLNQNSFGFSTGLAIYL